MMIMCLSKTLQGVTFDTKKTVDELVTEISAEI